MALGPEVAQIFKSITNREPYRVFNNTPMRPESNRTIKLAGVSASQEELALLERALSDAYGSRFKHVRQMVARTRYGIDRSGMTVEIPKIVIAFTH